MDIVVRPAPTAEQQAAAQARVQWDKPVGQAHAHRLLEIISAQRLTGVVGSVVQ